MLQRGEEALNLSWLQIPTHRILYLELLLLLVELAPDDILVDGIDDQVFKLADARDLQHAQKVVVWEDLRGVSGAHGNTGMGAYAAVLGKRHEGEVLELRSLRIVESRKRVLVFYQRREGSDGVLSREY